MELDPELGGAVHASEFLAENTIQLEEDHLGYNPQLNCGYDPQLRDDRRENKKKLKRRFEHIFEKYERDFEGIGDEIDLETGEIVVDNGHLQRMQNEHDTGSEVRVDHDAEGGVASDRGDALINGPQGNGNMVEVESSDDGAEASDDAESNLGDDSHGNFSEVDPGADSATSPFDADESALEDDALNGSSRALAIATSTLASQHCPPAVQRDRSLSAMSSASSATTDTGASSGTPDNNILEQVPGLKESMLTLQSKYKRGQSMDQDAIQALGMSIANQLATFISRPGRDKSKRKSKRGKDSAWSCPLLPGDQLRKRERSPSPEPELVEPPPSGKKSIWAPIRHPRQQKRRRMKEREPVQLLEVDDTGTAEAGMDGLDTQQPNITIHDGEVRKCANCDTSDCDVWRKGPDGDLCNTCGMYLYRYGLMRPMVPLLAADDPGTPEETEGELDPLERDWWLACASGGSTNGKKKKLQAVGVKNSQFVVEEDALIIQLKEIDLVSWERMATYLPGRSAYALQCRYSKKLRGRAPEAREILLEQGYQAKPDANGIMIFSYTREPFKEEEDELLLKLHDEDGLGWEIVAASLPGRSPEILEKRYHELARQLLSGGREQLELTRGQRRGSVDSSNPSTKHLRYTAEEDAKIIKLREVDKLNWSKIAESFEGRNSFSLQKRYIRELCGRHPDSTLPPRKAYYRSTPAAEAVTLEGEISDTAPEVDDPRPTPASPLVGGYSRGEDALLLELRDGQGLTWEHIDPQLPGRSRTSLIKRYNYLHSKDNDDQPQQSNRSDVVAANMIESMDGEVSAGANGTSQTVSLTAGSSRYHVGEDSYTQNNLLELPHASAEGSHTVRSFTKSEDDQIMSLREVEKLPWSDIITRLPGRTVSSISDRYYHHLVPRKPAPPPAQVESNPAQNQGSPSPSIASVSATAKSTSTKRWTVEEDKMLETLRSEGKSWEEIATHLPGRSARAAQARHGSTFDATKKAYKPRQSLPNVATSKSQAPLLRKAVKNLRRRSESALSLEGGDLASLPGRPGIRPLLPRPVPGQDRQPFDTGNEKPKDAEIPLNHHSGMTAESSNRSTGALPNTASWNTERPVAAPYYDQILDNACPETPIGTLPFIPESSEPRYASTAMYATPARYNQQAHPYFVTLPARYPLPGASYDSEHQGSTNAGLNVFDEPTVDDVDGSESEDPIQDGQTKVVVAQRSNVAKGRRSQNVTKHPIGSKPRKPRMRGRREHKIGIDYTTDEDEVTSYVPSDDDFVHGEVSSDDASDTDDSLALKKKDDSVSRRGDFEEDEVEGHQWESEDESEHADDSHDASEADDAHGSSNTNDKNGAISETNGKDGLVEPVDQRIVADSDDENLSDNPAHVPQRSRTLGKGKREPVGSLILSRQPQIPQNNSTDSTVSKGSSSNKSKASSVSKSEKHGGDSKTGQKTSFDTAYVNAHPEETFHHLGHGRWGRGLPPPGASGRMAIRRPKVNLRPAQDQLFDTAHVDAHPEETFHHRGAGRWAKGLPPPGSSKMHVRSARAKDNPDCGSALDGSDVKERDVTDQTAAPLGGVTKLPHTETTSPSQHSKARLNNSSDPAILPNDDECDRSTPTERPPFSNLQLVAMALSSTAPEPMHPNEIFQYLEDEFDYFKHYEGWRNGIRGTLSRHPQFGKASKDGKPGWILTGVPIPVQVEKAPVLPGEDEKALTDSSSPAFGDISESAVDLKTSTEPKALSSDITEGPQSEANGSHVHEQRTDDSVLVGADSSELSVEANRGLLSSSPILNDKQTPLTVYGKASTPFTGNSTLHSGFQRLRSVGISTPVRAASMIPRISNVAELGGGKRIVQTPMRDFDDSEDELAL